MMDASLRLLITVRHSMSTKKGQMQDIFSHYFLQFAHYDFNHHHHKIVYIIYSNYNPALKPA